MVYIFSIKQFTKSVMFYSDTAKEALSQIRFAEHLVHQLRRANHHEKVEIILEVLQTLAENGKNLANSMK